MELGVHFAGIKANCDSDPKFRSIFCCGRILDQIFLRKIFLPTECLIGMLYVLELFSVHYIWSIISPGKKN